MLETLKKYWGFEGFRPMQGEIISEALAGRDVLAILPTGGGKSVCFQVPSMMREGICLVVSPLIALMKDQVQNLRDRGIPALAVYSGMTYREIDITLDNAIYGEYKFLYVSPERLRTEMFQARLSRMNVNFLVVDEALSVGDKRFRKKCVERVKSIMAKDNLTLLFVTHSPEQAMQFCTRGIVLQNGSSVFEGDINGACDYYDSH